MNACQWGLGEPSRGVQPARQPDNRDLAVRLRQLKRMTNEGVAKVEGWIGGDIVREGALALKEVLTALELLVAAVDQIGGECVVSGPACGVCDSPNATTRIVDAADELLDLE